MVTLHAYGEKAKEFMMLGAFGTFRADGIAFTITQRSVEGRDCIDLEIVEEPPVTEPLHIGARHN